MLTHRESETARPSRVVVLGARGFVASALLRRLRRAGIPCVGVPSAEVDLTKPGAARKLMKRCADGDSLVFASALTPDKGKDTGTLMRNLAMGDAVCDAIAACRPRHVVYVSSDAVYADDENPVRESASANPSSFHGVMHLARERMLTESARAAKVPAAVLRPSLLYGAGDTHNGYGPNRFMRTALADGAIHLFGDGEERRDHVYIDDLAEVLLSVLNRCSAGVLNIATGQSRSFREVAEAVAGVCGRPVAIEGSPRANPITHRHFDVTELVAAFPALAWTSLEEGLRRAVVDATEAGPDVVVSQPDSVDPLAALEARRAAKGAAKLLAKMERERAASAAREAAAVTQPAASDPVAELEARRAAKGAVKVLVKRKRKNAAKAARKAAAEVGRKAAAKARRAVEKAAAASSEHAGSVATELTSTATLVRVEPDHSTATDEAGRLLEEEVAKRVRGARKAEAAARRLAATLVSTYGEPETGIARQIDQILHRASRAARRAEKVGEALLRQQADRELRGPESLAVLELIDRTAEELRELRASYYLNGAEKKIDIRDMDEFSEVARLVLDEGRTYLGFDRLYTLWQATLAAPAGVPIVEVGTYRGGSAKFIAETLRRRNRASDFYVCDTFVGSADVLFDPAATDADISSVAAVREYLAPYQHVRLVAGDILHTTSELPQGLYGLVHLDVDWFKPTDWCLRFFSPRLAPGALIVLDDYGFTTCPGVKRAVDEFVTSNPEYRMIHMLTGQAVVFRVDTAAEE